MDHKVMGKRDMLFWGLSFALIVLVACNLNLSNTGFAVTGTLSDGSTYVICDDGDNTQSAGDITRNEYAQTTGLDNNGNTITRGDWCNDGILEERYCRSDGRVGTHSVDCSDFGNYVCSGGACVEVQECNDPDHTASDAEESYLTQSTTTGADWRNPSVELTRTDACVDENTLREYLCTSTGVVTHTLEEVEVSCGAGNVCQNGACVPDRTGCPWDCESRQDVVSSLDYGTTIVEIAGSRFTIVTYKLDNNEETVDMTVFSYDSGQEQDITASVEGCTEVVGLTICPTRLDFVANTVDFTVGRCSGDECVEGPELLRIVDLASVQTSCMNNFVNMTKKFADYYQTPDSHDSPIGRDCVAATIEDGQPDVPSFGACSYHESVAAEAPLLVKVGHTSNRALRCYYDSELQDDVIDRNYVETTLSSEIDITTQDGRQVTVHLPEVSYDNFSYIDPNTGERRPMSCLYRSIPFYVDTEGSTYWVCNWRDPSGILRHNCDLDKPYLLDSQGVEVVPYSEAISGENLARPNNPYSPTDCELPQLLHYKDITNAERDEALNFINFTKSVPLFFAGDGFDNSFHCPSGELEGTAFSDSGTTCGDYTGDWDEYKNPLIIQMHAYPDGRGTFVSTPDGSTCLPDSTVNLDTISTIPEQEVELTFEDGKTLTVYLPEITKGHFNHMIDGVTFPVRCGANYHLGGLHIPLVVDQYGSTYYACNWRAPDGELVHTCTMQHAVDAGVIPYQYMVQPAYLARAAP